MGWENEAMKIYRSFAKITQKSVNVSPFSVRKNADDLKNALESVVIPMFCNATTSK